jgi:hypothetical protein
MKIFEFYRMSQATQKTAFFQEFLEKNGRGVEALKLPAKTINALRVVLNLREIGFAEFRWDYFAFGS